MIFLLELSLWRFYFCGLLGMRKLVVGDKLYQVQRDGFDDFARYSFSEVVKLTKTLAILKNGVRLRNEARASFLVEDVGYPVYRERGNHWYLVSIKVVRKAQVEHEKIRAFDWFEAKEFSLDEKMALYKLFHK